MFYLGGGVQYENFFFDSDATSIVVKGIERSLQ